MTAYMESEGLRLRRKVRAVVLNERDEVLLVRPHGYREGEWTLAGGGVEDGEISRRSHASRTGRGTRRGTRGRSLRNLPVTNRFIYSADHKAKRRLDHDGQDAVMFVCRIDSDTPLRLQTEEVAEARWFTANDAAAAFPAQKQREVYSECLREISRQI